MRNKFFSFILILLLLTTACGKKVGFQALDIPKDPVRLRDLGGAGSDDSETEESEFDGQDAPADINGKSLADIAKWVVQNEARKIGAACNFFLQRVLYLMGFGRSSWMANDFDQYVKKNFDSYKLQSFTYDSQGNERQRLRNYIWSLPERTGLILQWKRTSEHGHIGVVQRIGDDLVIYHASLNDFRPKAQSATVEALLHRPSDDSDYVLNVFSDLRKKPASKDSDQSL